MNLRRKKLWMTVALAGLAAAVILIPAPALTAHPTERFVRVEASQYAFTPATLHANPGDRVTIELHSADVAHGIYVEGYGVSAEAQPGQPAEFTFVVTESGVFRLRCSITCGALHPFMLGRLTVGSNWTLARAAALAGLAVLAAPLAVRRETP